MDKYDHLVHITHEGCDIRAMTVDGFAHTDGSTDQDGAERLNRFLQDLKLEDHDTGEPIEITPSIRAKVLKALREEGVTVFDSEEDASRHPYVEE